MNDKMKLKRANNNPYYILATPYGEGDIGASDKNREVWNAWACQHLTEAERAAINRKINGCRNTGGFDRDDVDIFSDVLAWENVKNKVEKKYSEEMQKRLDPDQFDISLPDPRKPIDLTGLEFMEPIYFWEYIFPSPIIFEGSVFLEESKFGGSKFLDGASFYDVHFKCLASFYWAYFSRSTDIYMRASFNRPVNFNGAVTFIDAQFDKEFGFVDARIDGTALFERGIFHGLSDFSRTIILGDIEFSGAIFEKEAYFQFTQFKSSVDFGGVDFHGSLVFAGAKFAEYPDFYGVSLPRKVLANAEDEYWPQRPINMPKDVSKKISLSCAALRHNMAEQGLPDEAHFFFRHEMKVRSLTAKVYERWLYRIYHWGFSHGHSLIKPMVWLGLLMGLCGGIFKFVGSLDYCQALFLSLANTFSIFGLHRLFFGSGFIDGLSGGLQLLIGVPIIVSFILLFFLGLALRNRFRLK